MWFRLSTARRVLDSGRDVWRGIATQDILTFLRRQLAIIPLEMAALEKGQIIIRLPKNPKLVKSRASQ
jgi:hypothetical protein